MSCLAVQLSKAYLSSASSGNQRPLIYIHSVYMRSRKAVTAWLTHRWSALQELHVNRLLTHQRCPYHDPYPDLGRLPLAFQAQTGRRVYCMNLGAPSVNRVSQFPSWSASVSVSPPTSKQCNAPGHGSECCRGRGGRGTYMQCDATYTTTTHFFKSRPTIFRNTAHAAPRTLYMQHTAYTVYGMSVRHYAAYAVLSSSGNILCTYAVLLGDIH